MSPETSPDPDIIAELFATVEARAANASPETSYTARLFARGLPKIAQKFGEEAVETVIAATAQGRAEVIAESADLIYHLCVLWVATGVRPEEVYAELAERIGTSGLAEKASRHPEPDA